jgi:hypothetical protein
MYSPEQIREYIQANNLGSNPFGIAAAQQQYGVTNDQLDGAMGWAPGSAQNWWNQQNQQVQQTQAAGQSGVQTGQPAPTGGMAYNGGAGGGNAFSPSGGNPYTAPTGNPYAGGAPAAPAAPQAPQPAQAPAPQQPPTQVGQQHAGINPYLGTMAGSIAAQSNDSLQRSILPAIRSGAIMNGGLGGSRQGVVEANAINDQQRNLISSLSGLYGNAFESQQGRDLQRYGMDQQAGLTTRGQDLQRYGMDQNAYLTGRGQDQNFYTNQRSLDFQGQRLGADLFQQGMNGLANQGQGLYQTGMQEQAAGMLPYQQFANLLGPFTGLNQTNTNSTDTSGNVVGGALAGGLTLAQLYRLFSGG